MFCLPCGVGGCPLIPTRFGRLLISLLCFGRFAHDARHRCEMAIMLFYEMTANMLFYEMKQWVELGGGESRDESELVNLLPTYPTL